MAKAVYAATHRFDSPIRVGSHHFAELIAESHELLYATHPVSIASFLNTADNQLMSRLGWDSRRVGKASVELTEVTPFFAIAPGNRRPFNTEFVLEHCWRSCVPSLRRQIAAHEMGTPDWLVLDTLYQTFWPSVVKANKLGVRIADEPDALGGFSPALRRRWSDILEQADFVIAPTEKTADWAARHGARAIDVCPNGVDVQRLQSPASRPTEISADRVTAVFVGAIARWIDTSLLVATAKRLPEIDFLVVGPLDNPRVKAAAPSNLRLIGPKPYADLPAYLQHADIALAPFDVAEHQQLIEATSAIKLYEYLACGLPVVATCWPQSEALAEYIALASQDAEAFSTAIRSTLAKPLPRPEQSVIDGWSWRNRFEAPLARVNSLLP